MRPTAIRPWRRRWVLTVPFVVALGVALTAAVLTLYFRAVGDRALSGITRLRAVSTAQGVQNATQWQAISGRFLVAALRPDLVAPRSVAANAISAADTLGLSRADTDRLRRAQADYDASVDEAMRMVAAGLDEQAVSYDSNHVVPALQTLQRRLQLGSEQLEARDRLAQRVIDTTVVGTALLALLMATVLQRRRKLSELLTAEQQRGDARYRTLIDQSSDLVLVTDRHGRLSYLSPAAERLLPAGAGGGDLYDYVHPRDRTALTIALEAAGARDAPHDPPRFMIRLGRDEEHQRQYEVAVSDLLADEAVAGVVLTARDITEQQELHSAIEHQAMHDSLTGLPNRLLFTDRLTHAIARGERGGTAVAVLYLDLDEFKAVNDTLGHVAGDELLSAVSRRLSAVLRVGDTLCRLGGDEFAVLLEEIESGDAEQTAERLLLVLTEELSVAGRSVRPSASIGLAVSRGAARMSGGELLSAADVAMYAAKRAGKGRCVRYRPDMHDAVLRRVGLEADLRRANERGEIGVAYQPIVELSAGSAGRILGMEALMRWCSPTWGSVNPAEFIPIAEDSGLIVQLGAYVLRTACASTVVWNIGRSRPLKVSVNVSVRQLHEPGFPDLVADTLAATGLDPALLTLEITESLMLHGDSELVLTGLRSLGVRLALDDFGTGYASLSHLNVLSIDQIKIDILFVRALEHEEGKDQLTGSILALANSLRLDVVAEGIESVVQLDKLQRMGCPHGQGYLFSRPLSHPDFTALLGRYAHTPPVPRRPLRALPGGRGLPPVSAGSGVRTTGTA